MYMYMHIYSFDREPAQQQLRPQAVPYLILYRIDLSFVSSPGAGVHDLPAISPMMAGSKKAASIVDDTA
jgi:hypothetical protein